MFLPWMKINTMVTKRLKLLGDVMGLSPLPLRMQQAMITIRGEEDVPKTKFGLSSLKQLYPRVAPKMWRGKFHVERKVIISNLFNHSQTPIEEGWSVRKTQTRDFRGGGLTYNSHNGTDFAIPVGTVVTTAAPGEVVAVMSEFNRGGLKIFIDHGNGLMTCYAHLAKSIVEVGDKLHRGQQIALSGYSGIDGVISYPFGIPHVHFNVWLNAEPIDPFPFAEQQSLWRAGVFPKSAATTDHDFEPSVFDNVKVDEAIDNCKTPSVRVALRCISDSRIKAFHTIIQMNYYPTRFVKRINIYGNEFPRTAVLDLPFVADDFDGIVFLDDILPRLKRQKVSI